jgi:phosphohistidine swiveling domain-containing protein
MKPALLGSAEFASAAAGRKAASLQALAKAGFAVPPGFSVPAALELPSLKEAEWSSLVEAIGGFPVAVRSSGQAEDLEGASFAGLYDTYLDVTAVPELLEKIVACRASARSERSQAYLRERAGGSEAEAAIPVFVQRMARSHVAGVAFTLDPVTGREDEAVVECCAGLGDRLVSGLVAPTRYSLRLSDGEVLSESVGEDGARLELPQRESLRRELLRVQAHFGRPQDVEWCFDEAGRLWILQSRPVTSVRWRTDVEEFTNADFRDGGVSARVCTPLMYSLYRDVMQPSMQKHFEDLRILPRGSKPENWISIFYGRPYWNASAVKRALATIPGFDESKLDADLGIRKDYGAAGPLKSGWSARGIAKALPVLIAVGRCARERLSIAEAYGPGFLAAEKKLLEAPELRGSDEAFFGRFRELLDLHHRTESDYFLTIYNNANVQSDLKDLVAKIDKRTKASTAILDLLSGLGDVSHLEIQRGLLRLAALARREGFESPAWIAERERFLAQNGFHADAELDLACPRWSERPERVRELVQDMLATGAVDPEASLRKQTERFEKALSDVRSRLAGDKLARFLHAKGFEKSLRLARDYLSARERMREYSSRTYALVRAYALEAGRRLLRLGVLAAAEDVFFLDRREIYALAEGLARATELAAAVESRRLAYLGVRDFTPPNEIGAGLNQVAAAPAAEGALQGLGCSAGVVEAPVRVVERIEDAGSLQPGEILVTRFTDPGWTPVLGRAAGVVTEVGGLLSHAAVIGREYGIPAILNLPRATSLLKTGQRVRMDGSQGCVTVLD